MQNFIEFKIKSEKALTSDIKYAIITLNQKNK